MKKQEWRKIVQGNQKMCFVCHQNEGKVVYAGALLCSECASRIVPRRETKKPAPVLIRV